MKTTIPAVVNNAFLFFDYVAQITESCIPVAPDDAPEPVGVIGTNPRRLRIPQTPGEWMDACLSAPSDSPKAHLLYFTRLAIECLDEGDDMTALDYMMRVLALAMHEFGDDAKRRAEEIMDVIHHDIVRVCCMGQRKPAVAQTAEILSAVDRAQTEEERIAIRRYARGLCSPEEAIVAERILNSNP